MRPTKKFWILILVLTFIGGALYGAYIKKSNQLKDEKSLAARTYVSSEYNFKMILPESYFEKFELEEGEDFVLAVYDKANKDAGFEGELFRISAYEKQDWESQRESVLSPENFTELLFERDDYAFVLTRASGEPYSPSDTALSDEYKAMYEAIPETVFEF